MGGRIAGIEKKFGLLCSAQQQLRSRERVEVLLQQCLILQ